MGELLGLTWDCVNVFEEAIENNSAYLYVNKELQRISKEAIRVLDGKDVLLVFPEEGKRCKTVRILKLPKTESSVRKVFLPRSVARSLVEWKKHRARLPEGVDPETLMKVLKNPEMAALLQALAKSMG